MRANYGNVDFEDVYVADPHSLEVLRDQRGRPVKPAKDVEYPMLRLGVNNAYCKFFENAMVTVKADDLLRDYAGMTGQRDWYDVTLLCRVSEWAENVEMLSASKRKTPLGYSDAKSRHTSGAHVVPLFADPEV